MLSFFNSKKIEFNISSLLEVDMHSHILPGIDDGAKDVATSLQLIDGLIAMGYKELIASPHIMSDLYPNTEETITAAYHQLKAAMDQRGYTIPLSFAAEYLIDEAFEAKIAEGPLLTFGNNYVLVETMFRDLPPNLTQALFELETHDYQPVLAHPERYHYLDKKFTALEPFKERNCLLQLNILSLTGYYGPKEKEMAEALLDAGMVDLLGTDLHHSRHLRNLQQFSVSKKIARQLEALSFKNKELLNLANHSLTA